MLHAVVRFRPGSPAKDTWELQVKQKPLSSVSPDRLQEKVCLCCCSALLAFLSEEVTFGVTGQFLIESLTDNTVLVDLFA